MANLVTIQSISHPKVSHVTGQNSVVVTYSVAYNFIEVQARVVASDTATISDGTLVEDDLLSGSAGTNYTMTLDDVELSNARAVEGSNLVKLFATVPLPALLGLAANDVLVAGGVT